MLKAEVRFRPKYAVTGRSTVLKAEVRR